MKRILLIAFALVGAVAASAKNYKWDTEILYKGTPDAYTEKMCRLDVAYEEGGQDRPGSAKLFPTLGAMLGVLTIIFSV